MLDQVVCPTGCNAAALPAVNFNKCAPDARVAEIGHLAIAAANSTVFTDWLAAGEWVTRLDQSAVTAGKIRLLTVRANKPASTKTTQTMTGNRQTVTNRHHVINFVVDEMTDENYDFFRTSQCGIIQFKVWYINNATKDIYGGNNGIVATLFGEPIYDEGTGVLQRFAGTLEWDAPQDPPRGLNPIAGL